MGRFLFATLLITNLLVCPLRCFSCQTGNAGEACVMESPCDCCAPAPQDGLTSQHDLTSQDKAPAQQECACPSCICEGATLQDAPEVPSSDALIALESWPIDVDAESASLVAFSLVSPERPESPPVAPVGRDALIAYGCWLQ